MDNCFSDFVPIFKGEKFDKGQNPQNDIEQSKMKDMHTLL